MSEAEHPVSREIPPRNSHRDDAVSRAAENARAGFHGVEHILACLENLELSEAPNPTSLALVLADRLFHLAGDITTRARILQASAASDD